MKKAVLFLLILAVLMAGAILSAQATEDLTVVVTEAKDGMTPADGTDQKDDWEAIQEILNLAVHPGLEIGTLTVKVPAGNYLISDKLIIYSDTILELEAGATISCMDGTKLMLASSDPNGTGRPKNITVRGGKWDGKGKGTTQNSMFFFLNSEKITVEDTEMVNFGGKAIDFQDCTDSSVSNCSMKDVAEAVKATGCENLSVKKNGISGISSLAFEVHGSRAEISENTAGDAAFLLASGCTGLTISGNRMENTKGGEFKALDIRDSQDVTIAKNKIKGYAGAMLLSGDRNAKADQNELSGIGTLAFEVYSSEAEILGNTAADVPFLLASGCTALTISGNRMENTTKARMNALDIRDTVQATITNNTIKGYAKAAMVNGSENVRASDNEISGTTEIMFEANNSGIEITYHTVVADAPFLLANGCTDVVVRGNSIDHTKEDEITAIYIVNAPKATISYNRIKHFSEAVRLANAENVTAEKNEISGIRGNAFYVTNTLGLIGENTAKAVENFLQVVDCRGSEEKGLLVRGNRAEGTGTGDGILLLRSAHITLKENQLSHFRDGISLEKAEDILTDGNTVSGIGRYGINVKESGVDITGNTVTECGEFNIHTDPLSTGTVKENTYDLTYGINLNNNLRMVRGTNNCVGFDKEPTGQIVYYHENEDAPAHATRTLIERETKIKTIAELGFTGPEGTKFAGWKAYWKNRGEWWQEKNDETFWGSELQPGAHYALFKDGAKMRFITTRGSEVHLYAQWEGDALLGDVNGDLTVDGKDAIRLMKYLAGEIDPETGAAYAIDLRNADINQDGKVDELDLVKLMKKLTEA